MLNPRFAKDYLLHRFKGKTRHGTHSPFVYRLVDEVIYDFSPKKVYAEVESRRREMISDTRMTTKGTLMSPKLYQLLYRLVVDQQPGNIVELGSGFEITSVYLKKAAPDAKFYISKTLPDMFNSPDKLDFVLINTNQTKADMLRYFEWCLPKVHENTLLVFDDIYRNKGMKEAWSEIKAHPQVTVTIDLFWMGLVYFRKGQVREDFFIKF